MTDRTEPTKVVVLGGGYAGTMAANHLRLRSDIAVTLVNPRPTFVERIRLHQLVAGTHQAIADYGSLLGDGIELVVDTATRIDTANRTVELATRPPLAYDYLEHVDPQLSAGPLGTKAADTVLSRIAGTAPAVIDQAFFGACISLGRRSGILQPAHTDDTATHLSLTGRVVAPIKEAVCRSTLWSLRREARKAGSAFWFEGGSRPETPAFDPVVVTEP